MGRIAKLPPHDRVKLIISVDSRVKLAERGYKGENYNDIVERLLNQYKKRKTTPKQ